MDNRYNIDPDSLLERSHDKEPDSLINYQSGSSFLHCLNPTTKLTMAAGVTIIAFLSNNYLFPVTLSVVLLIISIFSGISKSLLRVLLPISIPLVGFITVIQGLFYPPNTTPLFVLQRVPLIGSLVIWEEGVTFALLVGFRLVVLIMSALLTILTTHPRIMATSLTQKGVPKQIAYVFLATFQFIPQMRQQAQQIMNAQQARGLDTKANLRRRLYAFAEIMSPLLISMMITAQTRALALESRGFSRSNEQTSVYDISDTNLDRTLRWATIVLVFTTVGWVVL